MTNLHSLLSSGAWVIVFVFFSVFVFVLPILQSMLSASAVVLAFFYVCVFVFVFVFVFVSPILQSMLSAGAVVVNG